VPAILALRQLEFFIELVKRDHNGFRDFGPSFCDRFNNRIEKPRIDISRTYPINHIELFLEQLAAQADEDAIDLLRQ
jgi:hypothetical protein